MSNYKINFLLFGAFANVFYSNFAFAQTTENITKFDNEKQCEIGSKTGIGTFATQFNQAAIEEWKNFERQTIDNDGKLSIFGGAEGETNELVSGSAKINKEAPWYNVYRYWMILFDGKLANDRFRPYSYKNHDFMDADGQTGGIIGNNNNSAQKLIAKINSSPELSEEDKIIISDAINRASIIDAPWSGTFISAMHKIAIERVQSIQPQALNFRLSSRHSNYIKEAYLTAKGEIENNVSNPNYGRYRACDPSKTKPRIGDMICYVRLGTATTFKKYSLSDSFQEAAQIYFYGDDEKLKNTHCDIISSIDNDKNEIEVIGGNVQQSVTKKTLNLDRHNKTLTPSNYDDAETLKNEGDKICKKQNCRLNAKPWFVLLQSRY